MRYKKRHHTTTILRRLKPKHYSLFALLILALFIPFWLNTPTPSGHTEQQAINLPAHHLPPPASMVEPEPIVAPEIKTIKITVGRGESLATIFKKQGLEPGILAALLSHKRYAKHLKRLTVGEKLELVINADKTLERLVIPISVYEDVIFTKEQEYQPYRRTRPLEQRQIYAQTTIRKSLYLAGKRAGIPASITRQLASIFAWEIDFSKDIRPGDSLTLIYDAFYQGKQKVSTGKIIAAEFKNQGKTYSAFRYTDNQGHTAYYNSEGKSLKKAFNRYPTNFSHISSHFNRRRKHPVLKILRPHYGIDYAAPLGTPIKAAGDGRIVHLGKGGGYGNVIKIRHNIKYLTVYAHMLRFRKGLRKGSKVKQGELIGYVGKSGLATGPHLHYEFRIFNKPVNPLTVSLPRAKPLRLPELVDYREMVKAHQASLHRFATARRNKVKETRKTAS